MSVVMMLLKLTGTFSDDYDDDRWSDSVDTARICAAIIVAVFSVQMLFSGLALLFSVAR